MKIILCYEAVDLSSRGEVWGVISVNLISDKSVIFNVVLFSSSLISSESSRNSLTYFLSPTGSFSGSLNSLEKVIEHEYDLMKLKQVQDEILPKVIKLSLS